MNWNSEVTELGGVTFPEPMNVAILMMPFLLEDVDGSLPDTLETWKPMVRQLRNWAPVREGVAYVTIDERATPQGEPQRRPGLHVDGWADDVDSGVWGGGGGWGKFGLLMASSHVGCAAWVQDFHGEPRTWGDCEHLRGQCRDSACVELKPTTAYHLDGMTVHESIPLRRAALRQFIRLSMPSDAGWPASCTPNPFGVEPAGPILPVRPSRFTDFRDTP